MKLIFFCCFLVLIPSFSHGALSRYVYKFGQDVGSVIYNGDGRIPILQQITQKAIPVPKNAVVTYVQVIVDALAPPKVDYNRGTNVVTIRYSWAQVSMSNYSLSAKAIIL